MNELTPSQLKIDGMPETEVLRIEGNVTVPKGLSSAIENGFNSLVETWREFGISWSGNIVPQDSPTGMRLYRVEEVEGYKTQIDKLFWIINDDKLKAEANDKAYSYLAEQLRQEKENVNKLKKEVINTDHELLNQENENMLLKEQTTHLLQKIQALELRLRVKDSPIKAGLKRIWKWLVKKFTKNHIIEGPYDN